MTDTLYTISVIASDSKFRERLNAGAAQQNVPGDPVAWVWNNRYDICAAPGWAAAVDSWMVGNPESDPANAWATDQAVISDGMIISQIQVMISPPGQGQ